MRALPRLLVIALDAANPALLRQWAADGTLPTMRRLMDDGLSATTASVEGLYVGATWPSFYTGLDPSEHGIYWIDRLRKGSYWTYRCRPRDFLAWPSLWDALSRAGRRVVVLDVPLTALSPSVNGVQVVEWGVHDAAFGFRTTPRWLRSEILRRIGSHPAPANCDGRRAIPDYRSLADQLCRGARARGQLTRWLLASRPWDFAIQVFSETHCAGHQLWHFHDSNHPAFDSRVTDACGDLLRSVYQAVDAAVGEIVESVSRETTVVVTSLHGMSHSCGGSLLLPEILERLSRGRSAASSATALPAGYTEGPAPAPPVWRRAYHRLPGGLRDKAYRIRSKAASMLLGRESLLCADPTVKAFAVGLGLGAGYSGVRLNLAGREPHGALSPGVEQERFCDRLIADLLELRHHDADRPMVCKVHRARDLYAGERIDELPDLLVEWESEPPMGTSAAGQGAGAVWRAVSPNTGIVEMPNGYCRTGEHRREGLLVARGAGIAPRAIDRTLSILDLAPTFAYMLGCEMPVGQRTVIPELSGRPG